MRKFSKLLNKCNHEYEFVTHDIKNDIIWGRPCKRHIWIFQCKKCKETKIQKHI